MSKAMTVAERTRRYTEKLKKERLCIRCRKSDSRTLAGRSLCDECNRKQTEQQREKRQERLAKGLCTSCGKNKPESGRTCEVCRVRSRADNKFSRAKKKRVKEE